MSPMARSTLTSIRLLKISKNSSVRL
jgi:hypothetical protein